MSDSEGMIVARITIERRIYDDAEHADQTWYEAVNPITREEPSVIEQLGMLRLAEASVLKDTGNDSDDEDDDD